MPHQDSSAQRALALACPPRTGNYAGEKPGPHDFLLKDNGTLVVGDTTFTFYFTPGHTQRDMGRNSRVRDGNKSSTGLKDPAAGIAFGPEWTGARLPQEYAAAEAARAVGA